ncbi:hypothetical protein A6E13_16565 [Aliivibrio fischeri]|uniref:phage tail terminator protein n=1 Tax=Aliivibrio fischeri TaxID=668 RepID=UPI00080E5FBD|nr:phage tail terminator protein [Aliivibrio fischeri]OCH31834.1 hypothetical protein A6E13_16565 [Aliivibrio fischeri]
MIRNTAIRHAIADHLRANIPDQPQPDGTGVWVKSVFPTFMILDPEQETPAILVYFDDGTRDDRYVDMPESYEGNLFVSIYLNGTASDDDIDAIGEQVKEALPIGVTFPGIVTLERSGFTYERSPDNSYRALHLNHQYNWSTP